MTIQYCFHCCFLRCHSSACVSCVFSLFHLHCFPYSFLCCQSDGAFGVYVLAHCVCCCFSCVFWFLEMWRADFEKRFLSMLVDSLTVLLNEPIFLEYVRCNICDVAKASRWVSTIQLLLTLCQLYLVEIKVLASKYSMKQTEGKPVVS